ncbi:MAG: apolipoprotein N-acyltransferase [Hyphomonadaceae bacterium]|nr:apolipoprotein N-acyltransferase [Hyphomonadaceae bacterium]
MELRVSVPEAQAPTHSSAPMVRIIGVDAPWRRRGVTMLAGALATLGHAPFQLTGVYVIAIVALVWLLDLAAAKPKPIAAGFGTGFWFALGHFSTGLYWVSSAFLVDSQSWGPIWGVPAAFGLAAGMALFWALGCALAVALWTPDVRRIFSFAVALFAAEWVRGHIFGGFPWLLPGYVWTPGEPVSQLASVFGIYGLTLMTLLFAATPAVMLDVGVRALRRFGPMIGAALLLGMAWGWGAQRIAAAPIDPPGAQPIVRVADAGLSQAEKWRYRPDQEWRVLQRYLDVTGAADESRAAIVVWPEGAIPTMNFFTLDNPQFLAAMARGLGDRALITGLSRCEPAPACEALLYGRPGGDQARLFNSAAVIDGVSGEPRLGQIYDKHRLVPFGEFIPLWSLVSRLNIAPLQRIGAGFEAGPTPHRLIVPEAPPALVLICYEAIFPNLIPGGEERPGWLVSVTNDAWFGQGTGPWQHYAMARYRAIEQGLPLARAASGGVSAIIDSTGREIASTSAGRGFAEAQLPPSMPETTYSKWGILLLTIVLVIVASFRFLLPGKGRST